MRSLKDIGPSERGAVGGKALELARLVAAGLPVPDAVVLPVSVFEEALRAGGLWPLAEAVRADPSRAGELRAAIGALALPDDLRRSWVDAARRLGGRVAVRSSGVDEDGPRRSFAGQHLTRLGVAPHEVPAAVLACWASLYEPRAMAYRGARGPEPGALAVVIQEMVAPESAGVLFTINPLNGSWREMVVEAVWGLGEGLVSGQLAPHWYLVRRPRRLPRALGRFAERVRLQVVDEDLPELPERFVEGAHGEVVRQPNPPERVGRRTLEPAAVRRLCRLGLRIERALGGPQDVEWARDRDGAFRVLQARPITAAGAPRAREEVLWTRRFVGERWTGPATPLGWSILEPVLSWFVAYPETQRALLGGGPAFRLVNGRPYLNATVFRHLAFKLPGAPPPRFMLELVPADEEAAWRQAFAVAPDLAVYGSILATTLRERRWRRFRWNPFTNHLDWDRFQQDLEARLPALARTPSSGADAVALVEAHEALIREYVGIHVCSLLFANLFWQLLEAAVATWLPERARQRMDGLATCPPGNRTVETNAALHALARLATPQALDALAAGDLPDPASPFGAALAGFLDRFGHRSEASWELMSPRWRRHPERLAPLLRAQAGSAPEAPEAHAARQEERHRAALAELRAALSGPRLTTAELLVHYTRRYLLLRENQRFWFDRLLWSLQEVLLWLGAQGVGAGALSDPEEVALLEWPELRALALGEADWAEVPERIAARRAIREADAAIEPPTFLRGDAAPEPEPGSGRLQGLGISPGRARGRVRVLADLSEGARLRPGEVLVARAVDPGWTPLFPTAAAVVLELGSVLSHGAVVAREYGIPAVVNLDGATRRLRDGQEVTVDGARGVVWVHPGVGP